MILYDKELIRMNTELIPSFEQSLTAPSMDLGIDFAEIAIDALFENEIVSEVPVAKTIVALWKTGTALRDRKLLKNSLVFLQEFHSDATISKKIQKHKDHLETDEKFFVAELERILLLLDRFLDCERAQILAKFFKAYINEKITRAEFTEVSDITDRIFPYDLTVLTTAYNENGIDFNDTYNYRIDRLISLGLLENPQRLGKFNIMDGGSISDKEYEKSKDISITKLGKLYYQYGIA